MLHQGMNVLRHCTFVIALLRSIGVTAATKIGRDYPEVLGELWDHFAPRIGGLRKAMQQNQGFPRTSLNVMNAEAIHVSNVMTGTIDA